MELTIVKKRFYELIRNIVDFNKISHAYMIEIDNYDEDFECVLDFVKLILCQKNNKNVFGGGCSECNICNQVESGTYVDLKIVEPDGNLIKKKQLTTLQEEFQNKSLLDNKRIYIIKEADKLNESSANTILKFLEEPEDDIIAILVTTNRYNVIETILSRCQILSIQDNDKNIEASSNVIDFICFMIRKNELFINYNKIYNDILPDKIIAKEFLGEVEVVLINYLNFISNKNDFSCDKEIINLLSQVEIEQITNFIGIIEEEIKKLDYNVNYKLWLDCLFAKLIGG